MLKNVNKGVVSIEDSYQKYQRRSNDLPKNGDRSQNLPWNNPKDNYSNMFDFSEYEQSKQTNAQKNEEEYCGSDESELSYDEDMILEQVRCIESQEEIKQFIEMDEIKFSVINPDFKKMYQSLKKKTILLMGIAKKYIENKDSYELKIREADRKQKEMNLELSKEKESSDNLKKIVQTERLKYKQLNDKFSQHLKEKANEESQESSLLEQKELSLSDLQSLFKLENQAQITLQKVTKKKNEILEKLTKNSKEEGKSVCIICSEKPVECLLQPCNHACTCYSCAQNLQTCPMDRLLFTNIKRIFLS